MDWKRHKPEPPAWALEAGLPAPLMGEGFQEYVSRIGLDFQDMTIDLDERTAEFANLRLASALQVACPASFKKHLKDRTGKARDPKWRGAAVR